MFENRKKEDSFFYEGKTTSLIIDFIGGEPLLYPDLVYDIIEYFEYKCLQNPDSPWLLRHMYSISTNGTTYFSPGVQKLLEDFSSLISLGITLDGIKEYHDACRVFADGSGGSYDIAKEAAIYHL
jgi:sulfatase maturation enzyme AslB (radical SAM superfamily)